MKKLLNLSTSLVILLAVAPLGVRGTVFFTDDFSNGSTTNQLSIPGGTPTASSTSYDFGSSKNSTTSPILPHFLSGRLAAPTTSGYWEAQALFTTNPVALVSPGDYVNLDIVFTNGVNTNGTPTLLVGTATKSSIWIGLYSSGAAPGTAANPPVAGALANAGLTTAAGSAYATGNCQLWAGYVGEIRSGGASLLLTRPVQDGTGTASSNQELLGNGVSGGTYANPGATTLATSPVETFTVPIDAASTMSLRITLDPAGSGNLIISNAIFSGSDESGPILFSNIVSTSTILASSFDGLAFGAFMSGTTATNPQMDVASITITGQVTVNTNPPTITAQPVPVTVASNGSCAFTISATGVGVTYQWARNGTNLPDGGNISGATSSQLVVSPVGPDDELSGPNGYYCIATASGGYSTNSVTNSLTEVAVTNLTWSGSADTWDLNTTADWLDQNSQAARFNYGDPVAFNDTGAANPAVTLSGGYLSAASVTITGGTSYSFLGTGSFAGPGNLIYASSGFLTINNLNTYSGGTIISNASADLFLNNWKGLGSGPLTLAKAGGQMEITIVGSGSTGLANDIDVQDDFTIIYDASSTYGAVFFGNLSGTAGKTLTISVNNTTNAVTRVRISGANTVYNGNLNIVDSRTVWATYQSSGSETYNGLISGSGAVMEKGADTYLNGANTFSGGTYLANGAGPIGLGIDSTGPAGAPTSSPLGTSPLFLIIDSTSATTGTGWLLSSGGAHTVGNAIQFPTGTNNLTLGIGGANNLTLTGPFTLNGNDLITSSSFMVRILQVTNQGATTFAGVISDNTNGVSAGYGLLKTGSGALYLNATNTYTGITTNSNTSTNGIGLLAGSGVISSPVFVQTNSAIGGGPATAIGTLTISNNLTLNGNVFIRVNKSSAQSNDVISVTGTLANIGTGTLTVTNLGSALVVGDRFVVFNKAVTGVSTLTVTGGGPSVSWNNNLATDGSISVASLVVVKPVITSAILSGGNVILNGTNGTASSGGTFYVLSSTNVAASLTSWTPVATNTYGTGGAFSVTNAIVPGVPNNFYMLKQP